MSRTLVISERMTLERVEWTNTTLVKEIVPEDLLAPKQAPGRAIVIYGSASVVRALARFDMIDQYNLLIFSVVIGRGKLLLPDLLHIIHLKPISTKTYASGVVELAYQRAQRFAR